MAYPELELGVRHWSFYTHLYVSIKGFSLLSAVVLFSAKSCFRCRAVERHLDKLEVEYSKVMVDEDLQTADALKARGFNGLPVVKIGDDWSEGYHPDALDAHFKPAKCTA